MGCSSYFSRWVRHRWLSGLGITIACLASSFPALDNGFISDDFVHLEWAGQLLTNPSHLFGTPPIGFRPTSFVVYLALKQFFGFASPFYYVFSIFIQLLCCLLVRQLARILTRDEEVAWSAAVFFAVVYQSQEAIYYIAAMNESLMVLFGLSALVLWLRQRYLLTLLAYSLALLSKESALILPLLAVMIEWGLAGSRPLRPPRFLVWLIPAAGRLGFFFYFRSENYYVTEGFHAISPAIGGVLINSLVKLMVPWLPIVLLVIWVSRQGSPGREGTRTPASPPELPGVLWNSHTWWWAAWPVIALLPYVTLTYQSHVTSRHYYLAAVGWVVLLAILIGRIALPRVRLAVFIAFLVINPGYTWLKKDRQFEERAASTTQLLEIMRNAEPAPMIITGFPGNPWNGKLTTRLVPGWSPELLMIDEEPEPQIPGIRLHWDGQTYQRLR